MRHACLRALAARALTGVVLTCLTAGLSSSAAAQEVSKWDVFGGYSYMRFDSRPLGFAGSSNLNGWNAAVAYNFTDALSLAADASGHYGNSITAYTYSLVPQYSYRWERSRAFAQFLIGKAQNTVNIIQPTRTGFEGVGLALGGGAGFDWDYNSRYSIRAIQVDYVHSHTFDHTQNDIRVSAGLIVHFGRSHKKRRL
ncbi:MAG TPA: outer membrane beta-barrel protein [Terriglobales bacterium]